MFTLIQLVDVLGQPSRRQLLDCLQPSALAQRANSQETSENVFTASIRLGLITELQSKERHVRLNVPTKAIAALDHFKSHLQNTILGVTDQSQDNYLLGQFTAWYAVQDERVMSDSKTDFEANFHAALYPTSNERVLSEEPGISAWRVWAAFLGWGWPMKFSAREEMRIVPDATGRIKPLLVKLLPIDDSETLFSAFMTNLSPLCPELDGGILFNQAWEASRGNEQRGNRLSLMLSTALRVLHKQGEIELIQRADATDSWRLFPTQSYINQVTHIRRKVAA
jgi:hypothetical protein